MGASVDQDERYCGGRTMRLMTVPLGPSGGDARAASAVTAGTGGAAGVGRTTPGPGAVDDTAGTLAVEGGADADGDVGVGGGDAARSLALGMRRSTRSSRAGCVISATANSAIPRITSSTKLTSTALRLGGSPLAAGVVPAGAVGRGGGGAPPSRPS